MLLFILVKTWHVPDRVSLSAACPDLLPDPHLTSIASFSDLSLSDYIFSFLPWYLISDSVGHFFEYYCGVGTWDTFKFCFLVKPNAKSVATRRVHISCKNHLVRPWMMLTFLCLKSTTLLLSSLCNIPSKISCYPPRLVVSNSSEFLIWMP